MAIADAAYRLQPTSQVPKRRTRRREQPAQRVDRLILEARAVTSEAKVLSDVLRDFEAFLDALPDELLRTTSEVARA